MSNEWFARPVLFVADIDRSVDFYVEQLGFTQSWRYEGRRGKPGSRNSTLREVAGRPGARLGQVDDAHRPRGARSQHVRRQRHRDRVPHPLGDSVVEGGVDGGDRSARGARAGTQVSSTYWSKGRSRTGSATRDAREVEHGVARARLRSAAARCSRRAAAARARRAASSRLWARRRPRDTDARYPSSSTNGSRAVQSPTLCSRARTSSSSVTAASTSTICRRRTAARCTRGDLGGGTVRQRAGGVPPRDDHRPAVDAPGVAPGQGPHGALEPVDGAGLGHLVVAAQPHRDQDSGPQHHDHRVDDA